MNIPLFIVTGKLQEVCIQKIHKLSFLLRRERTPSLQISELGLGRFCTVYKVGFIEFHIVNKHWLQLETSSFSHPDESRDSRLESEQLMIVTASHDKDNARDINALTQTTSLLRLESQLAQCFSESPQITPSCRLLQLKKRYSCL